MSPEPSPAVHDNNELMEDIVLTNEELYELFGDDQDNAQQPLDYDTFQPGFSDDEGGEEAFDRSWSTQKPRKTSPNSKKSPRRSNVSDGDDESSPRSKRPRKSLFGGPTEELQSEEQTENLNDQIYNADTLEESRPDLRLRMSSLNIEQQDSQGDQNVQKAPDAHHLDQDLDLRTLARASMSPAPSRAPSEGSIIIPPDTHPVYELRKNIDRSKAFTYIDTDKTGNYDPAQEAKLKATRLQKTKNATIAKKKGKAKVQEKKELTIKCIVKLQFQAFGNVRNLTNDEDNWPENWSEVDSDDEKEMRDVRDFYRRQSPGIEVQTAIEDPRNLVDDLTGYPAARGCKRCRELDRGCSMVEGGTFPCDQCEDEEDEECTPILRPNTKGSCQQCVANNQESCSFEDNPDQSICDTCATYENVCNALPPKDYKTPRISIDEIMYGPDRKHTQCTFCRGEKKRCSLKKKTDKPPCKYCKKHGIGCTFYDLPKMAVDNKATGSKNKTLGPMEGDAPEVSKPGSEFFSPEDLADMNVEDEEEVVSREATPEIEMEDSAGNKGMLTKIKTSIAYPLQINVTMEKSDDCNFCSFPVFGFVGHFEREVHVIRWNNGLGYTEVGGGHCEEKGPTNMCTACTTNRLQVIVCLSHEFLRLCDDNKTPDFFAIADELISAEPGSEEVRDQLTRWCSMCFSTATWGCITLQPSLVGDDDDEIIGCGLKFCNKCYETLRDVYFWDLEALADAMVRMPKTSDDDEQTGELQGKPRVDVDFLRQNGLLMRITNASEQ